MINMDREVKFIEKMDRLRPKMLYFLFILLLSVTIMVGGTASSGTFDLVFCGGKRDCPGKNPLLKGVNVLQQSGARPRWSPDGQFMVFDRKAKGDVYHVFLMTRDGQELRSLTQGKPGIPQRNSGNATFDSSGKWVIFVAEEPTHFLQFISSMGDPGVGLFSNLWATDLEGSRFSKLTNIPIKRRWRDATPIYAIVNPLFSPDGRRLVWTERYANGSSRWGQWRVKAADFLVSAGTPSLANERVLLQPQRGNYVTAMGFLNENELIVSGNLDGQPEYGMDVYRYNLATQALKNLTNTPEYWEEDASVTPGGRIIFMSNSASRYKFNFGDPHWAKQAMERDYFIMDADGGNKQRLTYFNDPSGPYYAGKRILTVASNASPDGRYLAATLGVDLGSGKERVDVELKIAILEFSKPL